MNPQVGIGPKCFHKVVFGLIVAVIRRQITLLFDGMKLLEQRFRVGMKVEQFDLVIGLIDRFRNLDASGGVRRIR